MSRNSQIGKYLQGNLKLQHPCQGDQLSQMILAPGLLMVYFFLHPTPLLTDQIIVTTFNKFQNYSVIQILIEKGEYYA
jgi:hypothetical protein